MASIRTKPWAQRQALSSSGALDTGVWAIKHNLALYDPGYLLFGAVPVTNINTMCAGTSNHAQVHTTLTEIPELKVDACPSCQFSSCLCANEAKTFVWNVTATRLGEAGQRDCVVAGGKREGICPVCMSGPNACTYSCLLWVLSRHCELNVSLCSLQAEWMSLWAVWQKSHTVCVVTGLLWHLCKEGETQW